MPLVNRAASQASDSSLNLAEALLDYAEAIEEFKRLAYLVWPEATIKDFPRAVSLEVILPRSELVVIDRKETR